MLFLAFIYLLQNLFKWYIFMSNIYKTQKKILLILTIFLFNSLLTFRAQCQFCANKKKDIKKTHLRDFISGERFLYPYKTLNGAEKEGSLVIYKDKRYFKVSFYNYVSNKEKYQRLDKKMQKYSDREIAFLTKSDHPNIVKCFHYIPKFRTLYLEAGRSDLYYFTRERLKNIKKEDIKRKVILDILIGITSGLNNMHERGYVHRDLKPENVILFKKKKGEPIRVALIDFTRVKKIEDGKDSVFSKKIVTTPIFCSSSVIMDFFNSKCESYKYSRKDDVYSLGLIIHSLIYPEVNIFDDIDIFLMKKGSELNIKKLFGDSHKMFEAQRELHELNWVPRMIKIGGFYSVFNNLIKKCLYPIRDNRPSTAEILNVLTELRTQI